MVDTNSRLPIATTRLVIDGENIPFGAYQAIYHKITKKTETLAQAYSDSYTITFEDIKDLHRRLEQSLSQYRIAGKHCEISHELKDSQSRQYSSFEKFAISDNSISACSDSLTYELNFLIILPAEIPEAEDIAQRYKLTVSIENQVGDKDPHEFRRLFRIIGSGTSIRFSLEYSDYAVALAIKSMFDGWVAALPSKKPHPFFGWISSYKSYRYHWIDAALAVPFAVAAYYIFTRNVINAQTLSIIIVISFALFHISLSLFNFLMQKIEDASFDLMPKTALMITRGDEDRGKKANSRTLRIVALASGVFGAILSIFANLFSSIIYDSLQ